MALDVEDGTGKATSESFISVTDADTYHSNHGNTTWAALATANKEAALRKATEYMEQAYRLKWRGYRVTSTQRLSWPRAWCPIPDAPYGYGSFTAYIAQNVVLDEAKRACAELALIASAADLNPTLERTTSSEKVGDIAVTYDTNSPEWKRYRSVDMLLAPYLSGSSISVGLVRA
jgi:hypothetical protein